MLTFDSYFLKGFKPPVLAQNLPAGRTEPADLGRLNNIFWLAMGLPLDLEPQWGSALIGDKCDVLVEIMVTGTTKHLGRTVVANRLVVLHGPLPPCTAVTILGGTLTSTDPRLEIDIQGGVTLPHQVAQDTDFSRLVDVCSGIGCLSSGLEACGFITVASNDISGPMCEFLQTQGRTSVIHGDLGSIDTVRKIYDCSKGPALVAAGFSCQPWSALGDRQGTQDSRSSSLVHILRFSFFTRAHSILMECVQSAGRDAQVIATIKQFCKVTKFNMQTCDLALGSLMPATRNRWWCLLTNPMIPSFSLRPLPRLDSVPVVSDMLPFIPHWPQHDMDQLALDRYETGKFQCYGGLANNIIQGNAQLRTALHGWGNQLHSCPCLCRAYPLSEQRLQSRGLFGALVVIGGTFKTSQFELPCTRHLHPIELAMLHGMKVDLTWGSNLKLGICGLGQMASPVQSVWLGAQLQAQLADLQGISVVAPEVALSNHFSGFFASVREVLPDLFAHSNFQTFVRRVDFALKSSFNAHAGPIPLPADGIDDQNPTNSQREGRKDLLKDSTFDKQPATRKQEPEKSWKQPATEPPELEKNKQPAREAQELHKEPQGPNGPSPPFFAMPSAPLAVGPSPNPAADSHPEIPATVPFDIAIPAPLAANEFAPPMADESFQPVATESKVSPRGRHLAQQYVADLLARGIPSHDPVHATPSHLPTGEGPSHGISPIHAGIDTPGHSSLSVAATQPNNRHGGIPAFAVPTNDLETPRSSVQVHPPAQVSDAPTTEVSSDASHPGSFTQELAISMLHMDHEIEDMDQDPVSEADMPAGSFPICDDPIECPDFVGHLIQVVDCIQQTVLQFQVSNTTTLEGFMNATRCLGIDGSVVITDAVGVALPLGSLTEAGQQIFIRSIVPTTHLHPPPHVPAALTNGHPVTRYQFLTQQQAFVAVDEMNYYLRRLAASGEVYTVDPCVVPLHYFVEELQSILFKWASVALQALASHTRVISALLVDNHWFPVYFHTNAFGLRCATSTEGVEWMQVATQSIPNLQVHGFVQGSQFDNDCGFQTIAWLNQFPFQPQWPLPDAQATTASPGQAASWRQLYEHFLHASGQATHTVVPAKMRIGGAIGDVHEHLCKLLLERGVPNDEVKARSDTTLERLGRARVLQLLRGPQPWKDLKAAANTVTPRLQLVMSSELQRAIQHRVQEGQPFGNRKAKKQSGAKRVQPIQINPSTIQIPEGIFREGTDVSVRQISISEIGPTARGVVLVTMLEAAPYLKFTQPVSSNGLALLILGPANEGLVGIGQEVRFPAKCTLASEPVLITAKLAQLGSAEICRNASPTMPQVDEVPNAVIKVLAFRDELHDMSWETFSQQPVRHIKDEIPALQTPESILDCWDRQFLTLRMTKASAQAAEVFAVSFRLTGINFDELLPLSGTKAFYFEPRSQDGRQHAAEFRVIWLNRQDKPNATVARQATKEWACLVRSGNRYGLRVKLADAQKVHLCHKPQQPFLESDQLQTYSVGPMPFGATRATLTKLFQQWPWSAKPTQPKGRSPDGKGILWEAVASQKPPFEVYQMAHSDILISEVSRKPQRPLTIEQTVHGSEKTIAALRAASAAPAPGDPWEAKSSDPWANYNKSKQAKVVVQPAPDHSDAIAAKVESRVLQAIQGKLDEKTSVADSSMADDTKVQDLENRVAQLEQTVHQHHQQQQQHNTEVAGRLTHVQQQVETQGRSLQAHFDKRLQEQLGHIERLLLHGSNSKEWRCGQASRSERLLPQSATPRRTPRSVTPFRFCALWTYAFLLSFLFRVGEALHPGPANPDNHVIGTFNPTGALQKAELFKDLPTPGLWGVCETHLSKPGFQKFQQELKYAHPGAKFVPGAAAELVSQTIGSIGGKHTGVGILSDWPTRALPTQWSDEHWSTSRIQVGTSLITSQWVKLGVVYGYAANNYNRATMDRTDELLHLMTERIVYQSCGPRIICGDFNHSRDSLQQFSVWRDNGFIEVQFLASQKWGTPIRPTNRQGNAIDQVWISPELVPHLVSVSVEEDWFADHFLLYGTFSNLGATPPVPIWRKPLPLPWNELDGCPLVDSNPGDVGVSVNKFATIFSQLEHRVDNTLIQAGKPGLLPQHRGRCVTEVPIIRHGQVTPLRKSRSGDTPITYLGENFVHVKWCRQLRRLQSYANLAASSKTSIAHAQHKAHLWLSIRRAPGFPHGFPYAWANRSVWLPGAPSSLPAQAPDAPVADLIFQTFRVEFQTLERSLCQARVKHAKQRRVTDRNVAFQDVAKPRSLPVQTLLHTQATCVLDVAADGKTITYQSGALTLDEPVNGPLGMLNVSHHEDGKLTLHAQCHLEQGDLLCQSLPIGGLSQVFQAFRSLWDPMWSKHVDTPDHTGCLSFSKSKPWFLNQLNPAPGSPLVLPNGFNVFAVANHEVPQALMGFRAVIFLKCLQICRPHLLISSMPLRPALNPGPTMRWLDWSPALKSTTKPRLQVIIVQSLCSIKFIGLGALSAHGEPSIGCSTMCLLNSQATDLEPAPKMYGGALPSALKHLIWGPVPWEVLFQMLSNVLTTFHVL